MNGDLTQNLAITSSLALTQSKLKNIGTKNYENHQTQNVPKLKFTSHLSYQIPEVEDLRVLGGFQYSSSKYADQTGTAKVKGYTIFDLGTAYKFSIANHDTTLRFNIDNVFNKKYWRDVGSFMGDDYMFLGAPRTAQLAVDFQF